MRRLVLGVLVVLCAGAVVPAAALASASGVKLKSFICQTAASPAQRAMSITAVMQHVDGTAKLQMRFQLLKRVKRHGPTVSVAGRGLRSWLTPSDPTLGSRAGDTWIVKHPVVGLAAPAYYRFKVAFRWLDAGGNVIAQGSHHSPICFQPQLMPDLKVARAWASPAAPGRYGAVVVNSGATASSQFTVAVTAPDGTVLAQPAKPFASLAPHAQLTVSLQGAACTTGEQLEITLTPTDTMDDANPSDDTVTASCHTGTAASFSGRRGR